jgi:hypothetical protein
MAFLESIEIWVAVLIGIDVCLIVLFLVAIRQMREFRDEFRESSLEDVQKTIRPVLEDAKELAKRFESQLKEKQDIIRRLNLSLDDRMAGLNLLLQRTESYMNPEKAAQGDKTRSYEDVDRLQQNVIGLSEKGMTPKKIAANLGIAKGEVDLVLELKQKFEKLKQT